MATVHAPSRGAVSLGGSQKPPSNPSILMGAVTVVLHQGHCQVTTLPCSVLENVGFTVGLYGVGTM